MFMNPQSSPQPSQPPDCTALPAGPQSEHSQMTSPTAAPQAMRAPGWSQSCRHYSIGRTSLATWCTRMRCAAAQPGAQRRRCARALLPGRRQCSQRSRCMGRVWEGVAGRRRGIGGLVPPAWACGQRVAAAEKARQQVAEVPGWAVGQCSECSLNQQQRVHRVRADTTAQARAQFSSTGMCTQPQHAQQGPRKPHKGRTHRTRMSTKRRSASRWRMRK